MNKHDHPIEIEAYNAPWPHLFEQETSLVDVFHVDERLQSSSFILTDWPLSRVLLKNHADYPWLILVPRRQHVTEITQLCKADREQLMEESYQLANIMHNVFHPDKINIGALGNIVSQFHYHVVGRFHHDPLWPQGVWQAANEDKPYADATQLISRLKKQMTNICI